MFPEGEGNGQALTGSSAIWSAALAKQTGWNPVGMG